MYTKQEVASLTQDFWTKLGLYMAPILSAEGEKINWINYKTGKKYVQVRLQANTAIASLVINFLHPEKAIREMYFNQTRQWKSILDEHSHTNWNWQQQVITHQGKTVATVFKQVEKVSVLNKQDWPLLISFFKTNLIAMDQFWCTAKYSLGEME